MPAAPTNAPPPDVSASDDGRLAVVVAAAGRSSRMAGVDKTFAEIGGIPLIIHTLQRLAASDAVSRIALVVADDAIPQAGRLAQQYDIPKLAAICPGGARRQDSVAAGLAALGDASRWIAVHDGARPGIGNDILQRGLDAVRQWGAATAAVPVKDTIKVVDAKGIITHTPARATLWAAQTPQVFERALLLTAHQTAAAAGAEYTDDAAMVAAAGHAVRVFTGSYDNIKVTTPEDLVIVARLLTGR